MAPPTNQQMNEIIRLLSETMWGIAIGTISMWGEVVEHERGYRAQFARIRSIDRVVGRVDLARLRRKYGV